MKIYYQDSDIIVCKKEYGVSSQGHSGENMIDLLTEVCGTTPFVVHRLDITTEGVMVYALNEKSASLLSSQIANRTLEKHYLAVVHGVPEKSGEMTDLLWHDRYSNKSFVCATKKPSAKEARLEFSCLESIPYEDESLSLVKIHLLTGRTHQIRAQFSSRSFYLYGDGKYGAKDNDKIALFAHSLAFFHPRTGKRLAFSDLPSGRIWSRFSMLKASQEDSL